MKTKFRVFDKNSKKIVIDEQEFLPIKITNKGVIKLSPLYKQDLWEILDSENFEITQYIGLNDINNKEIYVGDYLKDEEGFIWEVLPLDEGMFKISCDDLLAVGSAWPRVVNCYIVGNKFQHEVIEGNKIITK